LEMIVGNKTFRIHSLPVHQTTGESISKQLIA
jgi:hypothetical protein